MNDSDKPGLSRRQALAVLGGSVGVMALGSGTAMAQGATPAHRGRGGHGGHGGHHGGGHGHRPHSRVTRYEAQTSWPAVPAFRGVERDVEILPDLRLHVWDGGGRGPVVVLLHPYSGSGEVFGYQHEALRRAGYRSISYSRRGFYKSDPGPADDTGTVAGDLQLLVDKLGVGKFHLVGTAAGGFAVFDYTLSHPERLYSATVASTLAGISEPDWQQVTGALLPEQWFDLPGWFQEIGPSYRAANPTGLAQWQAYEDRSKPYSVQQGGGHTITWDVIESIRTPTMILSGDADLYMPPSRMRVILSHVRDGEGSIISEAGHDAYFEQPDAFNDAVLSFIRKHRR